MNYHYYEIPNTHPGHDYSRRVTLIGLTVDYYDWGGSFVNNPWVGDFPLETIGSHH